MQKRVNIKNSKVRKSPAPLMRIINILEVISIKERPLSSADISYFTSIPKSSVHRLCNMLVDENYLTQDPQSKGFYPALRSRNVAVGLLANSQLYIVRHEIMRELSKKTGETCNLAVPDIDGMRYIDRVETNWPLRFQFPIGASVPFHCTASGKMFLSSLKKHTLNNFLDNIDFSEEVSQSIQNKDSLLQIIKQTRSQGYGEDDEDFFTGMIALSVPVYNNKNYFYASLSLQAPKQRLTIEQAREFLPELRHASKRLQTLLFSHNT